MPDQSSYTGEVSPGGAAQRRTAGALEITKVAVDAQMSNNCYLLRCTETGDQVLIDAADDAPRLLELIGDGGERDRRRGGCGRDRRADRRRGRPTGRRR
jgi:hypothetical protein